MPGNPVLDVLGRSRRRNPVLDVLGPDPAPEKGMLERFGDTLTESLGGASAEILENARTGAFRRDAERDEGFLDRAGSLLESGGAAIDRGLYTAIGALTGSDKARERARILSEGGAEVAGRTTWEDLKARPSVGGLGRYVVETGIESIPGMAAAATGPGLAILGTSQAGSIAEERARNDGRAEATAGDVFAAAPAGFGSALLERAGIESIFRPAAGTALKRIGGAAAGEGLTESVQGSMEYGGATIGTERGFDIADMGDQALAGAVAGAGMGGGIRSGIEVGDAGIAATGLRRRARAAAAGTVTEEDIESPLATEDIVEGRATIIEAEAGANFPAQNIPENIPPGSRVTVTMPDGSSRSGVMGERFTDASGEGVEIALDGGRTLREYTDTLADAGVEISLEDMAREADAIDAALGEAARQPLGVPEGTGGAVPSPEPAQPARGAAPSREGNQTPVPDGGAVIRSLFGDNARITSTRRGKDHPLTRKNPRSWHSRSNAAVDMAPIPGMTFEQAKARIEAAGYTLIEAINEVGKGRTKHATGDHWHFVIGKGGAVDKQGANSAPVAQAPSQPSDADPVEFSRPDFPEIEAGETPELAMPERRREAVQDDMFGGPSRTESEIAARDSIDAVMAEALDEEPDADLSSAYRALVRARDDRDADKSNDRFDYYLDRGEVPTSLIAAVNTNPALIDALGERIGALKPAVPAVTQGREVEPEYVEHATIQVGNSTFPFVSFEDASQRYRTAIETLGLGGSQTPPGRILDSTGKVTASLAYNGRVFPGDARDWQPGTKPLYDPSGLREDGLVPAASARLEPTKSGKGIAVIGASDAELAAIKRHAPTAKGVKRSDGAVVYSAARADAIRAAINLAERTEALPAKGATKAVTPAGSEADRIKAALGSANSDLLGIGGGYVIGTESSGHLQLYRREGDSNRLTAVGNPLAPKDSSRETVEKAIATAKKRAEEDAAKPRDRSAAIIMDPAAGTVKTVPLGERPATPSRFAKNKLFTEDKVEAARARLREKMNRLNSGVDPETLVDGMTIAGAYIEAGIRNFAEFAKAMSDDFGERITPFLLSFWEGARNYPGLDTTGMTPPDASRAMHDMLLAGLTPREPLSDTDVEAATTAAAEPPTPPTPAAAGPSPEQVTAPPVSATESDDARATTDGRAQDDDRAGDARGDAERAPEGEGDREAGADPDRSGRAGADRARGDDGAGRGGNRSRADAAGPDGPEAEGGARGDGDRAGAGDRVPTGKPDRGSGRNLVAAPGSLTREGSWRATAERNLDIVELVGRIEAENRPATPEEQAQLVRFTGWGASEIRNNLFRNVARDRDGTRRIVPVSYGEWAELSKRAAQLLTGDALETALQSTQYAHYTSEKVIRSIWAAVERLGFRGGSILEPGMGIGLFPVAAPAALMEASRYTGIELDRFSAKVARLLLPQENVLAADFIEQKLPDGFFDLAIGNPPFADIKVQADPAYRRFRFSLHDYFFAKSIDKVRPGGLLVFVTSRYTMDKQDAKARDYIAERADLLGAIRLPQTAFKENAGTEVVTDVLFLQRRAPGTEGDYAAGIAGGHPWTELEEIEVRGERMLVNEYFVRHPEMVLGRHALTGSMYRQNEYTVEPLDGDIEEAFATATERLPEGAMKDAPQASGEALAARGAVRDWAPGSVKEGGVYVSDKGELLIREHGAGRLVTEIVPTLNAADIAWLKDYAGLRDAVKQAQRDQLEDGPWEKSLAALNKAYDRFVKKHGQISAFTTYERTTENESGEKVTTVYRRFKNAKRLAVDVESTLVEALEKIGEDGKIAKAPFLLDRTLNKPVRRQVETAADALAVTLDEIGKFDAGHAAALLGVSRDELLNQLGDEVFQAPSGEWLLADEYLSGDVRAKLEEARLAATADPRFERNVSALEKVLPKPLAHSDITVKLGVGWIEPEVVAQFADEIMGEDIAGLAYEPATGTWTVPNARRTRTRSATAEWGTADRTALELLDALLNNRSIKVTRTERTETGTKTWTDQEATALANERANKIKDAFKAWLWTDAQRTARLVEKYNRNFNNLAPRRFDGRHLTFPGLSSRYTLYDHQRRAIWRIIATGNTYLNHAVGAGKTLEMIVAGMEQRRLGLIKKPMYVVPNHMLNQFAREFLDAYPAANIMVADEQAFHTDNRRRFMAQAALNDPDAIIVSHSSFGKIAPSAEARNRVLNRFVAELETIQEELKGQENRVARSKIEKQIEKLKQRFLGKAGTEGKDKALTFEEMGVDFLFVDEAHEFRKLDFATNRTAVKGIDANGSQRALDLYIKLLGLHSARPGRAGVLASGTPITNTMAEIYTVMRFMDPDGLEADGLAAFDAWAAMFGEVAAGFEQNAAGGYEMVERFSKFVNVPELMARVRRFMDVLTSDQLGALVKRPEIKGRVPENVVVPASDALKAYMKETLEERIRVSREWKPSPQQPGNPDPIINIITDGRLSALDMRFVNPGAPNDPGSKLNVMIDKIIEKHREFADVTYTDPATGKPLPKKGATQIVFSPVGFGDQIAANRGFDARAWVNKRLAEAGIPASAIAWMNDQNTHAKKEATFKALRAGEKRILAGSPKNMGTGVNVQLRLKVLHFLAPPWFPADVEQPHGRIIRQGNLNDEVEIYWYATKGTYDSTGWNMVSRKQRFIDQAMRGDASVRTIEDISEANQYEMASALAAGDERVIQLAGLSNDIERLQRLAEAHQDEQQQIQGEMRAAQRRIDRRKDVRANLEAALKVKGAYEPFALTVGDAKYDKPGEAGKALVDAIGREFDSYSGTEEKRVEIGSYLGRMPVEVAIDERENLDGKPVKLWSLIVKVGPLELEVLEDRRGYAELDPTGTAQRIQHAVGRLSTELSMLEQEEADDRLKLRMAEKRLGAPFEYAGELAEKIAERARLQNELAGETAAEEARRSTPKDSRVESGELPIVTVRVADWGKLPSGNRGRLEILRGRVKRWYRDLVTSDATVTTRDGRVVRFSDAGQDKTLRAGEDLLGLARAIPKIIERGRLIGSEPSTQPGIAAFHRYAAQVRDESGATTPLLVIVREAPNGTFHYSLNRYVQEGASDGPASRGPAGLAPEGAQLGALEGSAEDGFNLVVLEENSNAATGADAGRIEAVRADLAAALEKMGLAEKTRLRVVEGLVASSGFQGRFLPFSRTIMVALDAENEHSFVLHHEALHALREMGVFSKSDWKLLVDRALREPALWTSIKRRYPELDRDAQEEEAVADLFAMYQRGDFSPQGVLAKLLMRLAKILSAIRNALRGQGFTSSRTFFEVFEEAADGRAAGRATDAGPEINTPAAEARDSRPDTAALLDLAGSDPTWRGKMADAYERFRTAMQDRYLPLLKVQRAIERQTGKPLPPEMNPYLGEELMSGRIGTRLERLTEDHVEPLFDAMHEEGVSIDELESFLYARHAPERNARIAEINPEFEEGSGSGMTDLEAAAVMNRIRKAGKMEAMERLAKRVDRIRDLALESRVETGLMSQEDADTWRETYKHYVPLRGFAETGMGDPAVADRINRSGGGINVRGKESKRAFGRRSQADSILAYTILQAEEAIVRGETNRVAQKFVELAEAAPDPEFWTVQKVAERRQINPETGLVETYLTHNLLAEDKDWTVTAKFGGKERRVTMNRGNPAARRLADSMRNLTQHQLDWVTLHLGKLNRFLSAVNTSWNPEFVITNAFRDLQTAGVNMLGIDVEGLAGKALKLYPGALKGSTKGAFGKADAEWSRWYDEFTGEGGRVSFNRVEDIGLIKKRIESTFRLAAAKAGQGDARLQIKRGLLAVRDLVENANSGVENAVRLAAYRAARESGVSKPQAASIAKNLTVNFNRRGVFGPAMNALYLFYNASIQGSVRMLQATRSPKVRKMLAGVVLAGLAAELLNAMVSADDDDGESFYDKIPAYEKSRNIIIMLPGGPDYIKLPAPWGYNVFWELGRSIGEVGRRRGQRWTETAGNWLTTVADAFNPVGGTESLLNLLAPTVADPVVDLQLNRDFTGRPIMPEENQYGPDEPDAQRYWNSVAPHWKAMTDFLTDATGGDAVVPGAIDVSPETLEHLAGVVLGAAGATLDRLISIPSKAANGDLQVNDVPLARKVVGEAPAWHDKAVFYDRLAEVEQAVDDAKDYIEAEQIDAARRFAEDHERVLMLEADAKAARKEMRAIRKAKRANDAAREKREIDRTTYEAERKVIEEAERIVIDRFNSAWNATVYSSQ